jgi:hypothetical protein
LPSFNLLQKAQRFVILENFSHPKMLLAKQILQKNLSGILNTLVFRHSRKFSQAIPCFPNIKN